jgi:hypothetical protein
LTNYSKHTGRNKIPKKSGSAIIFSFGLNRLRVCSV